MEFSVGGGGEGLSGVDLQIALNLMKYILFIQTERIPCLFKICPGQMKILKDLV